MLERMETMLLHFQQDLGMISADIATLQDSSKLVRTPAHPPLLDVAERKFPAQTEPRSAVALSSLHFTDHRGTTVAPSTVQHRARSAARAEGSDARMRWRLGCGRSWVDACR